jgi:acetyl esterase/lipase
VLSFRKLLIPSLFVCVLNTSHCSIVAQAAWQPSSGHMQIPLWPGAIPDARPTAGPERTEAVTDPKDFVAGKPWLAIKDVSHPTLTVYSPKGRNTHVAVVVYPGGGYQELAIDLEGTEVCDWLNSRGITCVLLKYRVPLPRSRPYWGAYPESPMALEDAQRTMGLVRAHAKEWNIDPHKLGVLGFSAGGHLVAAISVHFNKRIYAPVDAADQESCRPDFAVALYPGHLSFKPGNLDLNPDIANNISPLTPPTFLLQNENDDTDTVWDALNYEAALVKAKVPVEFHSYAEGGHAFGLRPTKYPATRWPQLVEVWLHTIGMIAD